jgi:hypothetical protein
VSAIEEEGRERELFAPVDLCRADGTLDPRAIGWSRRPLVRANLRGHRLRKKRWEYLCVASDALAVGLVWADVDFLGLAAITLIDLATGETLTRGVPTPLGLGIHLDEHAGRLDARVRLPGYTLEARDGPHGTHLRFSLGALGTRAQGELFVELPRDEESMNVVVPFAGGGFQLNAKQAARPAIGEVRAFGRRHVFDAQHPAWGCIDSGRGVWPRDTRWNWGVAQGRIGGHDERRIGVNVGGQWTDATGSTENALFVDGRVEKLSEDLRWTWDRSAPRAPWRIVAPSGRVDLVMEPAQVVHVRADARVLASELWQVWGTWRGHVVRDDGERVVIDGLRGFAEDHAARW